MRRAAPTVFVALALVATACGGGDDEASETPRSTTTTTTAPAATTTTVPANLDAATVTLTRLTDVPTSTAIAIRADDPALYVATQAGQVLAVRDGQVDPAPVVDLTDRVRSGGEQGLLGLAFSPDGTRLFVHFSGREGAGAAGEGRIEELAFTGAPGGGGTAEPASARLLLAIPDPQSNHNGGQLVTGPDGLLYIALGDGGSQGDRGAGHQPGGNAQSLTDLHGKILRIDPTPSGALPYTIPPDNPFATGGGLPEIWSYGLRNPWRFTFDRETGDLWIADVGGSEVEEIDVAPTPSPGRGVNYGWNRIEGSQPTGVEPVPTDATPPVHEISHGGGDCSITGGYVYRGSAIPDLVGTYVFTDYCNGSIRAIKVANGAVVASRDLGISGRGVSSFGEDANGELYVLSQNDGSLSRIDPA